MYGILTTFNLIYRWHDFSPVRHEGFANSRLSLSLGSGAPLANIFLMGTNFFYVFVNKIHACLTDPDYGPSLVPEKSTFMYCVRDEGVRDFYDYLKHHVRRKVIRIACIMI